MRPILIVVITIMAVEGYQYFHTAELKERVAHTREDALYKELMEDTKDGAVIVSRNGTLTLINSACDHPDSENPLRTVTRCIHNDLSTAIARMDTWKTDEAIHDVHADYNILRCTDCKD